MLLSAYAVALSVIWMQLQIVVIRCPGAVLMPWVDKVKAVIVQSLPGEQAGVALAATLFGDAVSQSVPMSTQIHLVQIRALTQVLLHIDRPTRKLPFTFLWFNEYDGL